MKVKDYKKLTINSFTNVRTSVKNNFTLYDTVITYANNFTNQILELQSKTYHSDEYNELKKYLPCCLFSCKVGKNKADITETLNMIAIDIDKQDNININIDDLYFELYELPYTIFVAKSCGGQGIYAVMALSTKDIKGHFNALKSLFANSGIIIDKACSNSNRLRFLGLSSDVFFCDDEKEVIPFDKIEELQIDEEPNINVVINEKDGNIDFKYEARWNTVNTLWDILKDKPKCISEIKRIIKDRDRQEEALNYLNSAINNNKKATLLGKQILAMYGYEFEELKQQTIDEIILNNGDGNEEEWLYSKKDIILEKFKPGFNMLVSGTGSGKTEFWNQLAANDNKRIIVVEPYNSIVCGKYNENTTNIAAGKGKFIDINHNYNATNYLKFTKSIKGDMTEYDYVVIDESHLIGMQNFRSAQLVEFINSIYKYNEMFPNTKIVLQTATPSNEIYFFNIENTIHIKKDVKKFVQIHYTKSLFFTNTDDEGCENYNSNLVQSILYYAKQYINEKRKVFIYWGTGSMNIMKLYKECESLINEYKVAIFHTKNKGNDDMEYITNNKMIGDYDILISSCYFSVGCDLDDTCNAGIIIVGNNPYQEDEQVIGRFRKSKNIKVNIIVDKVCDIEKIDCGKLYELEKYKAETINKVHYERHNSLIKKHCNDDDLDKIVYMENSVKYYSDYERKFNFYETRGYNVVNKIKTYTKNNKITYDITEDTYEGNMPIIYLIDEKDEIIKNVKKSMKERTTALKEEFINDIVYDVFYDTTELYEKFKDNTSFIDWLECMDAIKKHYNIKDMYNTIGKDSMLKLKKSKLNDLFRYKIKIEKNETDKVEKELIDKLIISFDNLTEKEYIKWYLPIFYCYFVKYNEENKSLTYDLLHNMTYPVYNQWQQTVTNIISVDKDVRDYILNYDDDCIIDEYTKLFFEDIIFEEEKPNEFFEKYQNKYIHLGAYKDFLNSQFNYLSGKCKSEAGKQGGKTGGKKGKEIEIDGKIYSTVKEAAEILGISRQALYKRMKQ